VSNFATLGLTVFALEWDMFQKFGFRSAGVESTHEILCLIMARHGAKFSSSIATTAEAL